MKICWDNLEKLRYSEKSKKFYFFNGTHEYIEIENLCKVCGEKFVGIKREKNIFCSRECSMKDVGKNNLGKKLSKETKRKISENAKGRKHTEETKKKISSLKKGKRINENNNMWKGGFFKNNEVGYDQNKLLLEQFHEIRRSVERQDILEVRCIYCNKWYKPTWREINNRIKSLYYEGSGGRNLYCSKECKQECPTFARRLYPKGFKPSTSREVQPELRKLVFERDNWSCVKCGIGENLHCHHIDPVVNNPIESADINNCITLCKECHKDVHRKEGCRTNKLKC
jgi:hypothetical protein